MLSPNLTRFILETDDISDDLNNFSPAVENPILKVNSTFDHEKLMEDYNFFAGIFNKTCKIFKLAEIKVAVKD